MLAADVTLSAAMQIFEPALTRLWMDDDRSLSEAARQIRLSAGVM
jgi:hypothetical protein